MSYPVEVFSQPVETPPTLAPSTLMERVEARRVMAAIQTDRARRAEMGQFFTPSGVALTMAGMFRQGDEPIELLDAGAGVGSLTAAFVAQMMGWDSKPSAVSVTAFEKDRALTDHLEATLIDCRNACAQLGITLTYRLRRVDFLADSARFFGNGELYSYDAPQFSHAILNPPYMKVKTESATWRVLKSMGIETTNLYAAFLWLVTMLLEPDGQVVAITPRSFCNGPYYRRFRLDFLRSLSLRRIHVYDSRKQTFRDDEVLQENVIISAVRSANRLNSVTVSSSAGPDDEASTLRQVEYADVVRPDDQDAVIHIVPDEISEKFRQQMSSLESSLGDLGLSVSTGRVVDFRATEFLRGQPAPDTVPLIYPCHTHDGIVVWPDPACRKPDNLLLADGSKDLVVPSRYYVLVKRFSAKEEKRRVSAAVFDPGRVPCGCVGFENHLNYIHAGSEDMPVELARGLTGFLNSTLVDESFRLFSGHTQVNAADLRGLNYPTRAELLGIGRRLGDHSPAQEEIDRIVTEELTNMPRDEKSLDPLQGKRRIDEAKQILKELDLPKQQQNNRSALVLLALLDIKARSAWRSAKASLIGITEMMDYVEREFGVRYAPNTRETVRRQTVHQFMQAGLVILNPDEPSRPVNSPDNRYQVDSTFLDLVRSFGTDEWATSLPQFVRSTSRLKDLHARERDMSCIPVKLPTGEVVTLTGGGQNPLIKDIIEKFCSRYTPGGILVYYGDAGEKTRGSELTYLSRLGVKLDKHGKMPDVIIHNKKKRWLLLIEAVTSHGPMSIKRHNELSEMFQDCRCGLVFVTAFPTRKEMKKHLADIAWETEVWVAEAPTHMIHFNGDRFLGPY